jgi:integrase
MNGYITRAELQRMVDACDPTTLAGKRDRLLLVVLRALNGRSGEAAGLRVDDAEHYYHGINIAIGDQWVPVPAREFTEHLPSTLLAAWLDTLSESDTEQPGILLFRQVTKDDRLGRRSLTPWSINQIVKRAAAKAGLDNPERYTARIMRGPVRRKVKR